MANTVDHWNKIYVAKSANQLSWYEDVPKPSIELIERIQLKKKDKILIVGAGSTTLVDYLIDDGYNSLMVNDFSSSALNDLQRRLGSKRSKQVKWFNEDITQPLKLKKIKKLSLWHDRAVLHFLLSEKEKQEYVDLMTGLLKVGGKAIIAVFSLIGAQKCSGLDIVNYSKESLSELVGPSLQLVESFDYVHLMPSGEPRAYIYCVFEKIKTK